jgi:carbon monoxide dehydrogenase subunit G
MQVKLEKTVPVQAPPDVAWQALQDVPAVAACLPGAEVTDRVDATHYKGRLRIKLGPAAAEFKGDIEVKGIDAERRELRLFGKGSDVKGTSTATLDLTASLRDLGNGTCELTGVSEVAASGKLVSFGGRLMTQVADQVMGQFAANFAAEVAGRAGRPAPGVEPLRKPRELSALALLWGVIVGFFKSLLGRGPSNSPS